jgi:SAM-dependent methyltransferase
VQTLERATALLRGAESPNETAEILRSLGFSDPVLPLDRRARNALSLPETVRSAKIAEGLGALRGLALELDDDADLRQTLTSVAAALTRTAPQLLWLVISTQASTREVAVVCWSARQSRPRLLSLVCNRDRLFESDAETLCALSSAVGDSDLLAHSRWLDILGREAITRRFFRTLEKSVAELASSFGEEIDRSERHEIALLYISRLIFLSFLETKGWLDGDFGFLANGYSRCMASGGRYQTSVLQPLFFGTLNTPARDRSARAKAFGRIPFLNGGLFARSQLEKRRRLYVFSDEAFGNTYGSLLSCYRFSAREDSALWSEASIDPEMLGKAFEALMAADERKSSGAFYTPQSLVEEVVEQALASVLDGARRPAASRLGTLSSIRVLDPACGSGAFLVHTLERLAALRFEAGEEGSMAQIRRRVLTASIFGVDLNPMAVWLCELRLWLAIVIESSEGDPMRVVPLPNLDRHIRVGDSLAGGAFGDAQWLPEGKGVKSLRDRYIRASGPRKRTLARALDRAERLAALDVLQRERARLTGVRKELLVAARARDLFGGRRQPERDARQWLRNVRAQIRGVRARERALRDGAALPFSFAAHFADVGAATGFDLIVGNPPWVRLHEIPASARERLRRDFAVYRNSAWEPGAVAAGAGRGFSAQVDMSALFVERSCELLRPGGTVALLLPSKLWRSLAGGGVRQLLRDRTDLVALEDLSESPSQFEAAVYPSLLVSRKKNRAAEVERSLFSATVQRRFQVVRWKACSDSLPLDGTAGSPWLILPPDARGAFERLRQAGTSLERCGFGRPLLGVKTGCNGAYIVRVNGIDGDLASISSDRRQGWVERDMLRPLVRGETLAGWKTTGSREYLLWPHDDNNSPHKHLPPFARKWLLPHRDQLTVRSDLRGRLPWWTLFRTESARHNRARVIWSDFGVVPRAMAVEPGDRTVPLNSCYVVECDRVDDARALTALLNSPLAAAWLNVIAEPARGGYRRYLGWTMSLVPLPANWALARRELTPLCMRAMAGDVPTDAELLNAALSTYELTVEDVDPLLSWERRCD